MWDICLNIHYSAPEEVWKMIDEVYRSMGYWYGIENGCAVSNTLTTIIWVMFGRLVLQQ